MNFEYIKRVVGVPGDTIEIKSGKVYVNGLAQDESYLLPNIQTQAGKFLQEATLTSIHENNYVVMGDNRDQSSDSRSWGFVSADDILGKVWFCYNNCRLLKNNINR